MQEVLFTYENCYVMVFVELQNVSSRKTTNKLGESVLWLLLNLTVFSYPNPQNLTLHACYVYYVPVTFNQGQLS